MEVFVWTFWKTSGVLLWLFWRFFYQSVPCWRIQTLMIYLFLRLLNFAKIILTQGSHRDLWLCMSYLSIDIYELQSHIFRCNSSSSSYSMSSLPLPFESWTIFREILLVLHEKHHLNQLIWLYKHLLRMSKHMLPFEFILFNRFNSISFIVKEQFV